MVKWKAPVKKAGKVQEVEILSLCPAGHIVWIRRAYQESNREKRVTLHGVEPLRLPPELTPVRDCRVPEMRGIGLRTGR